jgi:hypothetical protein
MEINLRQYLLEECYAMVKHLSSYGKEIPVEASSMLHCEPKDLNSLDISDQDVLKLHRSLSKKIAPASPKTVLMLCKESHKSKWFNFLGPVGLVRRLMFVAVISLICFIAVSLSPQINFENIKQGIYDLDDTKLLIVMLFLLSAASMGASFSNLFQANQYIIKNIYDPKYESSYWIRYVLGIIAGIMLAVVIPVPSADEASEAHFAVASRPMLAMLGGFSAALVYRIMFRMVYAVESVFIGKQSEMTEQKLSDLQASNDIEIETGKQQFVNKLLKLQAQVNQGKSVAEIEDEVQKMISEIVPGSNS